MKSKLEKLTSKQIETITKKSKQNDDVPLLVSRVGRPPTGSAKQLIAIRIDPKLLKDLRKMAEKEDKPYQTFIHELLEKAAKKAA